jgi:hypothetical protein
VHMTFWFKSLKRRDHFEDLHGRTDLKETEWLCVDWIHLVQNRDQLSDCLLLKMDSAP